MSKKKCIRYPLSIVVVVLLISVAILIVTFRFTSREDTLKPVADSGPVTSTSKEPVSNPRAMVDKPEEIRPVEMPGQLVISTSAETGSRLYTAWPLIISANLWRKALLPDDQGKLPTTEPITLKAKTGSWREALAIEVKNETGNSVTWPFQAVNPLDESITLGLDVSAEAMWYLESAETEILPPGQYTITVSFDPDRMKGLPVYIALDRFHLSIEKEPAPLDFELLSEKKGQAVMLSILKNDVKTAEEAVDQLLLADPENIEGLRQKAKILALAGKKMEAISAVDKALEVYQQKNPDVYDPPFWILHERREILKDMEPRAIKGPSN